MRLGAVQHLLQRLVSGLLGFHPHLQEEKPSGRYSSARTHRAAAGPTRTSRTVISFSFSFPALLLTWVFLVSTHTTRSFTSDLDTRVLLNVHLLSKTPPRR